MFAKDFLTVFFSSFFITIILNLRFSYNIGKLK